MTLIIQDIVLYEKQTSAKQHTDASTGYKYMDTTENAMSYRIIGTKEQCENTPEEWVIDEVFSYAKEVKGSYWEGIVFNDDPNSRKPTLAEYNAKWEQDYARYEKMYLENGSKLLILRTS